MKFWSLFNKMRIHLFLHKNQKLYFFFKTIYIKTKKKLRGSTKKKNRESDYVYKTVILKVFFLHGKPRYYVSKGGVSNVDPF